MSKVSPSPKTLIAEQQVPSDLKQPFLSGGGDTTTTSSNNTPQTDSPIKTQLPETNGASAFSRPQDMNKVSVSPSSDPISPPPEENNNNNNQKVEVTNSSTMAVPEDIAITTNTGTNNNHHHINEPSQTHAPNSNPLLKPVVTPDATPCKNVVVGEENDTDEPEKETEDRTDASSPEPHSSSSEGQPISPPRTPPSRVPSVIHPLPKGSLDHPEFSPPQGLVTANRGRILSLDRAKDTINDALSGKMDTAKALELPKDQDDKNIGDDQHKEEADNDDVDHDESSRDSSDGESSYFAKHLPSPRNGRRYSYSSNHSQHSAPARTSKSSLFNVPPAAATNSADANKASDASLSFSDDESDDDELPPHTTSESPEPVCPLPSQVADMQLQTITRVHSVSSLVSSNEDDESRARSPQSTLSKDSGTTSDPSFTAELQTVVASSSKQQEQEEHNHLSFHHNQMIPSGRRSPLPTNPAFMAYYNTSPSASGGAYANPSPPTIVPGYNVAGMPHPQPQMMTQDQLAAWMAVGGLQAQQQQRLLGSASKGGSSSDGGAGGGAIPFVYSDDETDDMPYLVNQFAGHGGQQEHGGGGAYNTFNGSGDGGINRESSSGNRGSGGGNGINNNQGQQDSYGTHQMGGGLLASGNNGGDFSDPGSEEHPDDVNYTVYWRRWIMLFYMSILNLLSDWTCYSVAPIAILTKETFGSIDPEQLVTIFLGANAIATACEPIILARLGLRKTVLFGALLLMIGSMIKSGGLPPIIEGKLVKGQDEWRLSLGFFLVGLSQPLYQCTPALLSASWFPEKERTMVRTIVPS